MVPVGLDRRDENALAHELEAEARPRVELGERWVVRRAVWHRGDGVGRGAGCCGGLRVVLPDACSESHDGRLARCLLAVLQ